jgi:hypothetical protein
VDQAGAPRSRSRLGLDLTLLALAGVLLLGAVAAGVGLLYQQLYSPKAFVEHYLSLLSEGRAADALALPGVSVNSADLESSGLPLSSSDALLREAALGSLTDIRAVDQAAAGDATQVRVSYTAGGHAGSTTFLVERNGWIGVAPAWRFARSPLSVLDVTVRGSMRFEVNGFEIDKRQVSADRLDAAPLAPVQLLVFSPGAYRVAVDTAIAATPGVDVLADKPLANVPVQLQAEPTEEFVAVVQQRVDEFLAQCATQRVLQPTACPFGFLVTDRIEGDPEWSITQNPAITVAPDGANWAIPPTSAVAHIDVDVVSLFDGTVQHVTEDVEFTLTGSITVLADGSVSIRVGGE